MLRLALALVLVPVLASAALVESTKNRDRVSSTGLTYDPGPRIPDTSDVVSHVWFDGASIQDTKGLAWAATGTPTMVAASGNVPAGATFSTTAYYTFDPQGNGTDALDLSGANFTVCALYKPAAENQTETVFSNGASAANGGYNFAIGTPYLNFALYGSSVTYTASNQFADSIVAAGADTVGCYCGGRSGTNAYAQMNHAARTVAAAASPLRGTSSVATIGTTAAHSAAAVGVLYEIVWFNTGPTKARVDQICAKALSTF
jgi:hypothetical protein